MITVKVNKEDILKSVYFITAIIQKQTSNSMQGALSSKGDLMGGIFDRWINTVPESIFFNKIILPNIKNGNNSEIISDFYLYNPKIAGIAPDVIGLKTNGQIIPFSVFDNKWTPVKNMPQIEVKTFKKNQKMITLRDQDYTGKYLVMIESQFRIDYLLPFFDKDIFNVIPTSDLRMNDDIFIVSDKNHLIHNIENIDLSSDEIGSITLLKITNADEFMASSTFCEEIVSVQYINEITKCDNPTGEHLNIPLKQYCESTPFGLFRFINEWYEGFTEDNIPYYTKRSRSGSSRTFLFRTLDFFTTNIDAITILKKSMSSIYIKVSDDVILNDINLSKNTTYKIQFTILDRSSNNGVEYFMQKSLVSYIKDYRENLEKELEIIINGGK